MNRDWMADQLEFADISSTYRTVVTGLLNVLERWELNNDEAAEVMELTLKLVNGVAIYEFPNEGVWAPAMRGFLSVGDTVRVKADAYKSDASVLHNGRPGTIVAIRYGDIIVRYTDGLEPNPDLGVRHFPDALEKRIG